MRLVYFALTSLLAAGTSAFAQEFKGTVNEVTPAQLERGRAAVTKAGYHPTVLQFGQDGNLFFTATRGGNVYDVTVTRSGQIFASTGIPATQSAAPVAN